jgi:hypothetical protein
VEELAASVLTEEAGTEAEGTSETNEKLGRLEVWLETAPVPVG